jgi:hypothetical protein
MIVTRPALLFSEGGLKSGPQGLSDKLLLSASPRLRVNNPAAAPTSDGDML